MLIVAVEAGVAALAGGLAGVLLAAAVLAVFVRTVGFLFARREIPLVAPGAVECLWMGLASLGAVTVAAVLAVIVAAAIAAGRDVWTLIRGEGS